MRTFQDFQNTVRALVAERPTFRYTRPADEPSGGGHPACFYIHKDSEGALVGGCIVGAALVAMGVAPEHLTWADNETDGAPGEQVVQRHITGALTKRDRLWISTLQSSQDEGEQWQRALYKADAQAASYPRYY